jgi:hypothetical protein
MSVKYKYSAEKWAQVIAAPTLAGTLLMMSDMGITSIISETKAMGDAMTKGDIPAGCGLLFALLPGEMP